MNIYRGFCFTCHCTAEDLLKHVQELLKSVNLKGSYLLRVGMDSPKVNSKFKKELKALWRYTHDTEILKLGTCSLHPVHSTFMKILEKYPF